MSLNLSPLRLDPLQEGAEIHQAPWTDHQAVIRRSSVAEQDQRQGPRSEWSQANREFVEDLNAIVDRGELFHREKSFF